MNVYVVWYDNGEQWEDNYQYIDGIFLTREAAEKYLDEEYQRYDTKQWDGKQNKFVDAVAWKKKPREKQPCSRGYSNCDECRKYLDWLDNDYEPEDFCDEYDDMDDFDWYKYESWEIREWEVLE